MVIVVSLLYNLVWCSECECRPLYNRLDKRPASLSKVPPSEVTSTRGEAQTVCSDGGVSAYTLANTL